MEADQIAATITFSLFFLIVIGILMAFIGANYPEQSKALTSAVFSFKPLRYFLITLLTIIALWCCVKAYSFLAVATKEAINVTLKG